jgi:type IV fimbrial biogenesis protein FimT
MDSHDSTAQRRFSRAVALAQALARRTRRGSGVRPWLTSYSRHHAKGFTLMELMVVLAVAGVVLGLAVPSFKSFRANNRLTNAANDYLVVIQVARTEAVKRGVPVAICLAVDPRDEAAGCSSASVARGVIAFVDVNNDCVHDAGEELLRGEWLPEDAVRVRSNGECLSFASSGFPQPQIVTGVESARNTMFCDERGLQVQPGTTLSAARGVLVSQTGRAMVTRDITTGEGAPQDLRSAQWPGCP